MADQVKQKTRRDLAIIVLSDRDHKVIDRYGLLNEKAAERGRYLPHPTTYVIDKSGKVCWKFTEKDYTVRPTNQMIMRELDKLR